MKLKLIATLLFYLFLSYLSYSSPSMQAQAFCFRTQVFPCPPDSPHACTSSGGYNYCCTESADECIPYDNNLPFSTPTPIPPDNPLTPTPSLQCGGIGQPCCFGDACPNGDSLVCTAGSCIPENSVCGGPFQSCCLGNGCLVNGYTCDLNSLICIPEITSCGATNQQCCQGDVSCFNSLDSCVQGVCVNPNLACGNPGDSCCLQGNPCNTNGYSCVSGVCAKNPKPANQSSGLPAFSICKYVDCPCNGDPQKGGGIPTALGCVPTDATAFISRLAVFALSLAGGIAFLLMLYGVLVVATAAGNPERYSAGIQTATSALAGLLAIIFSATALQIIGIEIISLPGF